MSDRDERDWEETRSHKKSETAVDLPLNAADAREHYERRAAESAATLQNVVKIEEDKDGKKYLLGFLPIPKGMEAPINSVINIGRPYINKKGVEFFYDKTSSLLTKYKKPDIAHSGGLLAAKIFSGALIGAQPVTQLFGTYRKYAIERRELLNELSAVIEANHGKWRSNEVIQTAMSEISNKAKTGVWDTVADVPTLIPTTMYALEDYAALATEKNHKVDVAKLASLSKEDRHSVMAEAATQRRKYINEEMGKLDKELRNDAYYKNHPEDLKEELADHKRRLESQYDRMEENQNDVKRLMENKPGREERTGDHKIAVMTATELFSSYMHSFVDEDEAHRKPKNAYQMIKHLKQAVEDHCGAGMDCDQSFHTRDASDIRISGLRSDSSLTLKEAIIEIINQNERDHGRTVIGKALLPQLQPAVDEIADVIASGRAQPEILVNLVGNGDIVKHNGNKRSFATAEEASALIADQLTVLNAREIINKEEFYSNFENPKIVQEAVRHNLDKMEGKTKALFASLFPDDVLDQEGLKRDKITALRSEAHEKDGLYNFVAANVLHLVKEGPEAFKKIGISEDDGMLISELADKIQAGDKQAVKQAVDGRNKTVIEAVRTMGLMAQTSGKQGAQYWREREKEGDNLEETIKQLGDQKLSDKTDAKSVSADEQPAEGAMSSKFRRRERFTDDYSPSHPDIDPTVKELAQMGRPRPREERFSDRFDTEATAQDRLNSRRSKSIDESLAGIGH